jgi:Tfp pilus assembly protein FimV
MVMTVREKVLNVLAKGKVTDADGYATRQLQKKVPGVTMGSLSGILRKMEAAGEIERQVDTKRCYMIKLADGAKLNGQRAVDGTELIEGIISAVANLKAENEALKKSLDDTQKLLSKARTEIEQKQLELAGAHRQIEAAQREAQTKTAASDQLSRLREMLEM